MDLHLSVRLPVSLPCFSHSQTVILFCSVEPPCANSLLSSWRSSTTPDVKLQLQRRRLSTVSSALAETAASMAVAVTVVGAAATLLVKRSKTSESSQLGNCILQGELCFHFLLVRQRGSFIDTIIARIGLELR
ncbi:uncharacterized protein LOC114376399 isoform X6 [Glycine soja]|uniref:uncharacterized protein isoform X6 n=1 Tax=Glycine max TaxID=3847 RepID=UPI0003DEB355|nr:uncharacterized protein LOC100779715 isoform X6 [Glycine max]XP_028190299.1 uncharacterized protein LOC114376399 isoform X6 [Glycine soja]|eukprot:XP_006590286.1 uncharacterized protein LOC100779715 isoform X5 [Glycine max]